MIIVSQFTSVSTSSALIIFIICVRLTVKRTLIHCFIQISFFNILRLQINFIIIFSYCLIFISVLHTSTTLSDFIVETLFVVSNVTLGVSIYILILRVGFITDKMIVVIVIGGIIAFSFFVFSVATFMGWKIVSHLRVIVVEIIFIFVILGVQS